MEVKGKMSKDFTDGYNEAVNDILLGRGMWMGLKKALQKKLQKVLTVDEKNPLQVFVYANKSK